MKEFLMIFRNEKSPGAGMPSAEQMQVMMQDWQNWIGGIAAQGKFVSTNRLYPVFPFRSCNKKYILSNVL